jgi:hypothetical protein
MPVDAQEDMQLFLALSYAQRQVLLSCGARLTIEQRLEEAMRIASAANDHEQDSFGMALLSSQIWNILFCWIACGYDDLLTKLSYNPDVIYGRFTNQPE